MEYPFIRDLANIVTIAVEIHGTIIILKVNLPQINVDVTTQTNVVTNFSTAFMVTCNRMNRLKIVYTRTAYNNNNTSHG